MRLSTLIAAAGLLVGLGACATQRGGEQTADSVPAAPRPPAPWTEEFTEPVVLVADKVRIVGPPQLLDHLAVRADEALFAPDAETMLIGFLQVWKRRPNQTGGEVRAYIDGSQFVALNSLEVLARPGWHEVQIVGSGDVMLARPGEPQQRLPEFALVAPIEQR